MAAAQLKDHGVEHLGVGLHVLAALGGDGVELVALPGSVQHRHVVLPLPCADLGGDVHAGLEQLGQLRVDLINFAAKFLKLHINSPYPFQEVRR